MNDDHRSRLSPSAMVAKGRYLQFLGSFFTLVTVLLVISALLVEVRLARVPRPSSALWVVLVSALILQACYVAIRWVGYRQARGSAAGATEISPPHGEPAGLVVCCSGGGIKSASFCLGALQRLNKAGVYRAADAVVGVSGGGYMAAAFATLNYRRRKRCLSEGDTASDAVGAFRDGGMEVAVLRTRTDYLASSRRVKFNLTASLLFGIAFNLIMLWAVLRLVAWFSAAHALEIDVVRSADRCQSFGVSGEACPSVGESTLLPIWPGPPTLWLVPAGLMMFGALAYVVGRVCGPLRLRSKFVMWVAGQLPSGRHGRSLPWSVANVCNTLVMMAAVFALIFTLPPYAASALHPLRSSDHGVLDAVSLPWAIVLAGLPVLKSLTSSMMKGLHRVSRRADGGTGTEATPRWHTPLLVGFRQRLAPLLAVGVLSILAYLLVVVYVDDFLSRWGMEPPSLREQLELVLVPVGILLATRALGSANLTTLFPFYRDRLSYAYLEVPPGGPEPEPLGGTRKRTSSDLSEVPTMAELGHARAAEGCADVTASRQPRPTESWPSLVLCGAANVRDPEMLPTGRNSTPFLMTDRGIGLPDSRLPGGDLMIPSADYPYRRKLGLGVDHAIAISGAAVSPLAGRENRLIGPARLLLALFNIRLGVWMANPYWHDRRDSASGRRRGFFERSNCALDLSSPLRVVQEAFGTPSVYLPYLYVTDGGHYDNLGLVEALRRRPRFIIALDGSGDPEGEFPAMGQAIASARMDLAVDIADFDPAPLVCGHQKKASRGWTTFTARFPEGGTCTVYYIKSVAVDDLPWDLESYRATHPGFPASSATLETYNEFDFEAFRHLGWHLTDQALANDLGTLSYRLA